MEWWKAWSTDIVSNGLIKVYGATDSEIISEFKNRKISTEIKTTQRVIHYVPEKYWRIEYKVTQPPIYVYTLYLAGSVYKLISPSMSNGRLFNFFLNLVPTIFSLLTFFAIYLFVKTISTRDMAIITAGIYWICPLVLLNSPIQGYFDPLIAFFVTTSAIFLYKKQLMWSYVFLVMGVLSKPTAIIVFPVIFWLGLKEHSFIKNIKTWAISILLVLAIMSPFLFNGRILSVFQGVMSISESSQDLSRQSLNIWWMVQYGMHIFQNLEKSGVSWVSAILGGPQSNWDGDVPTSLLNNLVGYNTQFIGLLLLIAFTIINLFYISVKSSSNRNSIFIAIGLQAYAYFILRVGVQINHYFIIIPIFAIISMYSSSYFKYFFLISLIFFFQDIIFYGFGRDFNYGRKLLTLLYSGWITNLLALANIALFVWICINEYSACLNFRSRDIKLINK